MAPTPDQRRSFGIRLRELRTPTGRSQGEVGASLSGFGGENVSGAAVSEWERGVSAPDARNAAALEDLFGEPRGALGGLLGFRDDDPSTAAQIAELRAIVTRQGEQLQEIVRRLDRRDGRGSRR